MTEELEDVWRPRYDCEAYESRVVPRLLPIATELGQLAAPHERDKVLEVGAGTGLLTRLLLTSGCSLIASDVDFSMLLKASACLSDYHRCIPALVVASVTDLPFTAGAFDLIASNLTPLQGSDQAVREARRLLRRGGRIALSMWGPSYSEAELLNEARHAAKVRSVSSVGPGRAIERLQPIGFEVERHDRRFEVEHAGVEGYLRYRYAFGAPRDLSASEAVAYRAALKADLIGRFHDGPVRLDWNVSFLTMALARP